MVGAFGLEPKKATKGQEGYSLQQLPLCETPVYSGKDEGHRTPNLRFWRPLLYQLSYVLAEVMERETRLELAT